MRLGVHREQLAAAFDAADRCYFLAPPNLGWDIGSAMAALRGRAHFAASVDDLVTALAARC